MCLNPKTPFPGCPCREGASLRLSAVVGPEAPALLMAPAPGPASAHASQPRGPQT